jgi:hypothetical protein
MSSAFYPLGMKSYNNHVPQGGYKSWKGSGVFSNPVGNSAGHIRPLTNNDPGNVFQTGFGLARPIKHFRKGRVIAIPVITTDPNNSEKYIETSLINYNLNRYVKSSSGSSLGGGNGGRGLLNQLMDTPGSFSLSQNNIDEKSNISKLDNECKTCEAVGMIATYYPNNRYLTNNPDKITTSKALCCNEEKKARRRVLPASTILKKNYYTTLEQYRQNRCQTYDQRVFNFQTPLDSVIENSLMNIPFVTRSEIKYAKPGSALTEANTYVANCQPNLDIYQSTEIIIISRFISIIEKQNILSYDELFNLINSDISTLRELYEFLLTLPTDTKNKAINLYSQFIDNPYIGVPVIGPSNPAGCKLVIYKPNNPQFAQQGAVSSSTQLLKLNVTTIEKNLVSFNERTRGRKLGYTDVAVGNSRTIPFILKNKAPPCQSQIYTQFQNPKICSRNFNYGVNKVLNLSNDNMNKLLNISSYGTTPPSYYDSVYV